MQQIEKPTFHEALRFWFKLGWISFGGPAGQIAIMHEYIVEKHRWISDKKFLHALNYCMLLPGPEAQQLATYTGWLLHGKKGGFAAGFLFILPSIFILLLLSIVYVTAGKIPWVYALFNGLKPAVIAIVIVALVKIGKKSLHTKLHYATALLSFICIFFLNIPFPLIILSAILLAIAVQYFMPSLLQRSSSEKKIADEEEGYFLTTKTISKHTVFSLKKWILQIFIFIILWLIPAVLFYFLSSDFLFWKQLWLFFSQAACVTFGGAYAVLPYVAQKTVVSFHWLSSFQMIDGLALGETTPGPLIMVLAFVGFMGAYNNFGGSLMAGSIGLLATVYFTFLPCFLFIFAGAPLIERTQHNQRVKDLLSIVSAAVVGVILNLTIYLGEAVLFGENFHSFSAVSMQHFNYVNLVWVVISFIALFRFKVDMILWIGISAIFGLSQYLIVNCG